MTAQTTEHISSTRVVEISQTHYVWIIALFVAGYLIHALLQIDAIARAKNNPVNSRWRVVVQNWPRLLGRFFVSALGFSCLWNNASAVPSFLGYFGITLSATAISIISLPMTPTIAGVWGFAVDSLLAYAPILKNALPPIEMVEIKTEMHQTTETTATMVQHVPAPPPPTISTGDK